MNKKSVLKVITASALTLTLGLGTLLGAAPQEQIQAQAKTDIEHTSNNITTVSSSKAVKISGKYKTKAALNMRKGASTKYKKVTTLKKGAVVTATYKKTVSNKKWYKVKYKGKTGWVSASYLKKYTKTKKVSNAVAGNELISIGRQYLGVPYVWGGMSPSGFDCSGFTAYVYKKAGYGTLPHSSNTQYSVTKRVSSPDVGDLIFFGATPSSNTITHVGIYAGNGQVLHAAGNKVQFQSVAKGSYWAARVIGYGSL
ncbi:C40 family peptidase [Rummeliibacillus sp. NPDC094406]|uniref:C40 family peptidase n=1 Tax=Rummeliibacillus sp. NPDC094406 TaxID=3364511 RepID=UPI003814BEB1